MRLIDLTGQRFGKLFVLERDFEYQKKNNYDKPYWKCVCDCGNIVIVNGKSLRSGATKSCGCLSKEQAKNINFVDITGKRFGKLTVIQYLGNSKWSCLCDCGNKTEVIASHLKSGHTTSCGCNRSKGELFIKNWLRENKINFQSEYTISTVKNKNGNLVRFDFAIFDNNGKLKILIEYNGKQHYDISDPWYKDIVKNGDEVKEKYANDNNIPLYIIKYNDNIEQFVNSIDFSEVRE